MSTVARLLFFFTCFIHWLSATDTQEAYWYQSSVTEDAEGALDLLAELNYDETICPPVNSTSFRGNAVPAESTPEQGRAGRLRPPLRRFFSCLGRAPSPPELKRESSQGRRNDSEILTGLA
jgi:hypothetical protein